MTPETKETVIDVLVDALNGMIVRRQWYRRPRPESISEKVWNATIKHCDKWEGKYRAALAEIEAVP